MSGLLLRHVLGLDFADMLRPRAAGGSVRGRDLIDAYGRKDGEDNGTAFSGPAQRPWRSLAWAMTKALAGGTGERGRSAGRVRLRS